MSQSVQHLVQLARTYADRTGLSLATVGTRLANDGKLFDRLERGGDLNTASYEKHVRWLTDHMPPAPPVAAPDAVAGPDAGVAP